MSRLPEGDRGQRYEVRCSGYPKEGLSTIGWTDSLDGAGKMLSAILKSPGAVRGEIYDRQEQKVTISRYGGVLR